MMRVVVSLDFCGIIPGSSTIVFGNMVGKGNGEAYVFVEVVVGVLVG